MKIDIWKETREKAEVLPTGQKVLREEQNGRYFVRMWQPKAIKPFAFCRFDSLEERESYIKKKTDAMSGH